MYTGIRTAAVGIQDGEITPQLHRRIRKNENRVLKSKIPSQMLHVFNLSQDLASIYGKCRQIFHPWSIWTCNLWFINTWKLLFGFDLAGWHTSKEKTEGTIKIFNHKYLQRLLSSTTCLVSVQTCEAVKVKLAHYMTIFMSRYCTSFRVRERTNFFEIKNSVKQLTLEGVNNERPMDHIARTG